MDILDIRGADEKVWTFDRLFKRFRIEDRCIKLLGRNGFHQRRYCIDNGGVLVTILLSQFERRNPS